MVPFKKHNNEFQFFSGIFVNVNFYISIFIKYNIVRVKADFFFSQFRTLKRAVRLIRTF